MNSAWIKAECSTPPKPHFDGENYSRVCQTKTKQITQLTLFFLANLTPQLGQEVIPIDAKGPTNEQTFLPSLFINLCS